MYNFCGEVEVAVNLATNCISKQSSSSKLSIEFSKGAMKLSSMVCWFKFTFVTDIKFDYERSRYFLNKFSVNLGKSDEYLEKSSRLF